MGCLVRLSENSRLAIASGYCTLPRCVPFQYLAGSNSSVLSSRISVRSNTRLLEVLLSSLTSEPEHIRFTTTGELRREVHGFLWLLFKFKYKGATGTLPPLIISPHGGPTGIQPTGAHRGDAIYVTSRGYTCCFFNHTSSSAHGTADCDALRGEFGIVDRDDVSKKVQYFAKFGRTDCFRVGIANASSGGYCGFTMLDPMSRRVCRGNQHLWRQRHCSERVYQTGNHKKQ